MSDEDRDLPSRPEEVPDHDLLVDQAEMPLIEHLVELRNRLLRSILVVLVAFFPFLYFANDLYLIVAEPLMAALPDGTSMIATEVASPFLTPFKLALVLAVFASMPWVLYQLWAFVAPGLYAREKHLVAPLIISSVLLFYGGMAFAYFAVFPLVFAFLLSAGPEGITPMTDINRYLEFVLKLFFAFGFAFEIPIATLLLVRTGFVTPRQLATWRPYVVVVCFVAGMLLTPPDIISQVLLAIPMWALFEIGLILSRRVTPRPESRVGD